MGQEGEAERGAPVPQCPAGPGGDPTLLSRRPFFLQDLGVRLTHGCPERRRSSWKPTRGFFSSISCWGRESPFRAGSAPFTLLSLPLLQLSLPGLHPVFHPFPFFCLPCSPASVFLILAGSFSVFCPPGFVFRIPLLAQDLWPSPPLLSLISLPVSLPGPLLFCGGPPTSPSPTLPGHLPSGALLPLENMQLRLLLGPSPCPAHL